MNMAMLRKSIRYCRNRLTNKLSIQLVISFLVMFALVVAVSFTLLYTGIVDILQAKAQDNDIQRFQQFEYNINRFCSEIDLISRRLIINAGLQELIGYKNFPQSEKSYYSTLIVRNFSEILSNYDYIKSILYYGSDGLTVKCSKSGNFISYDEEKTDWFYHSEQCRLSREHKQKLIWHGGYTDDDFGVLLKNGSSAAPVPEYYITASRNVLLGENSGALVINIGEVFFTSIYNSANVSPNNIMYITDGDGGIISGKDRESIGKVSPNHQKMSSDKDIEIYSFATDIGQVQAVYYRLKAFGGILVGETPMSDITKDISRLRNILVMMFIVSIVLIFILSFIWIGNLMRPLSRLTQVINRVGGGNLGLTLEKPPHNEVGTLIDHFNRMSTNIKELFERNERVEAEKRSLEMETLRAQINPHFIYNTLNTIKWMAVINKEENIAESIAILADFLEPIFKTKDALCTVRDEIRYTSNYIKLVNYRFAGGFNLKVDIPEELMDSIIIRFILQPIVENSLFHGLINRLAGEVSIAMWREGCDACIRVADNGDGMTDEQILEVNRRLAARDGENERGIGLPNVNRRLRLQYGDGYGISVKRGACGGAEVLLKMNLLHKL